MPDSRRGRPTLRCLTDDLGLELPDLGTDLGLLDHPFLAELRRIAPTSPDGQKRILSIDRPLVYRIRVSSERGATWLEDAKSIVWLCAAHRREGGSQDDAYAFFIELHEAGRLLPNDDDSLRDRAEAAIRLQRGLTADLIELLGLALAEPNSEHVGDLGDWLPCRLLVLQGDGVEEIWCALSIRSADGAFVREAVRDLLFATLEQHVAPALFETRNDWPGGDVEWFEVVRLGMREPSAAT